MSAGFAIEGRRRSATRPQTSLADGRYSLRFARTRGEIEPALRLRFEVFNLELHEGFAESFVTGLDEDEFDRVCEHLIVTDGATGKVVGTYRMQTGGSARRNSCGFYSAREFDFSPYQPVRESLIELGRACIHKDHRTFAVISLLWRGIVDYALQHRARYLIGCSSLTSQDPALGSAMFHHLSRTHLVSPELQTRPLPALAIPIDPTPRPCPPPAKASPHLPQRWREDLRPARHGPRVRHNRFPDSPGYQKLASFGPCTLPAKTMSALLSSDFRFRERDCALEEPAPAKHRLRHTRGLAPTPPLRNALRVFGCVGIFLHGLPRYFRLWRSGKDNWRALWAQWISRMFLRLIHCDVRVNGAVPGRGLVVSNHLSYLDVLVIFSVCPAAFVSKDEVRHWPIFGLLTRMAGSIFVDRERKTAVAGQLPAITSTLKAGLPVVLFPEGTSSDGSTVLPFRSSLLQAAVSSQAMTTPTAIGYEMDDGSVAEEICYWRDMVFARHFWNLLGKESLTATLHFGTPHPPPRERKEHARNLRFAILQLRGEPRELAGMRS